MQAVGRLAAEPVLNASRNGGWTKFRLLDTRFAKGESVTEAVTFVAFGQLAEDFCSRVEKGQVVHAWGHQQTERYTGSDGVERTEVRYVLFEFIAGPRSARARQNDGQAPGYARRQAEPAGKSAANAPASAQADRSGTSVGYETEDEEIF